jgi:DNA polymerase-3 subunit gamma/tau
MTTIYRKYRPQTFSALADQDHIATTLQNEIIMGTIAHAYLFSGPRGVGKTTSARLLAKAINCIKRDKKSGEPCDACDMCQAISAGRCIDVIEIDAASQTGVDNVRENIIENAQFKPTSAAYKVFIIDEVHMLSTNAFNALLKTLEEPPAHVVFILATTELHKLPATVISRCQRFHFKKISYDKMFSTLQEICKLEEVDVAKDVLDRIIIKSDGGLRDAESLLGQVLSLHLKKITARDVELLLPTSNGDSIIEFLEAIIRQKSTKDALTIVHRQVDDGVAPEQFILTVLEALRAMLTVKAIGDTKHLDVDFSSQALANIQKLGELVSNPELIAMIDAGIKRRVETKQAPLPELPLELLAVELVLIVEKKLPLPQEKSEPSATPTVRKIASTDTTPTQPPKTTPSKTVVEAPTPIVEPPQTTTVRGGTVTTTIEDLKKRWSEVMTKMTEVYPSLVLVLNMAVPKQIVGDQLVLSVPYKFHKDKIDEGKSRRTLESVLEACFKEKIFISCTVEAAPAPTETALNDLALAFGGQVVE